MTKYGLAPNYVKRAKYIMKSKRIEENVQPNFVNREFNTDKRNQTWCTDITYLIWKDKRVYLSTILDLYDRRVVAYKLSNRNDINLVVETLNYALKKEKDVNGLIIHSDQGFQYTSNEYKAICISNGIQISMSRKGTPIDDSPMESWHAIPKKETLYNNNIISIEHYVRLVKDWIKFYSATRLKTKNKNKRYGLIFLSLVYFKVSTKWGSLQNADNWF